MSADGRLPVTILTGFLGSGKTTLLAQLLRHAAMQRSAVIINEFGEIGLDHDLVATTDETTVQLQGGCLCCTIRSDLAAALEGLYARHAAGPSIERVVIETTGLADPAPILATLMGDDQLEAWFRLAGVVTTVDAAAGRSTLERHVEATHQVAVADRLLLTKTDLVDPVERFALESELRRLNPAAPLVEVRHGQVDIAVVLGLDAFDPAAKIPDVAAWLQAEGLAPGHHHHHHHDVNRHGEDIRAFCLRRTEPIPTAAFETFVDLLWMLRGPDLLRVKGVVNLVEMPERPLVLHAVQHVIHPPAQLEAWPSADRDTRLVFITRNVAPHKVEIMLDQLVAQNADIERGRAQALEPQP